MAVFNNFGLAMGETAGGSGTIKYNAEELEAIIGSYNTAINTVSTISGKMHTDVQTIRNHWEGEDAEHAEVDLKMIENQIESIENNLNEIAAMLSEVQSNFGEVKY